MFCFCRILVELTTQSQRAGDEGGGLWVAQGWGRCLILWRWGFDFQAMSNPEFCPGIEFSWTDAI